jgi:hypothetical protein
MNEVTTLSYVLEHAGELPWNEALFLPKSKNWALESRAAVWDADDCEEGEDVPQIAASNDLVYVLGIGAVQDIVSNAKQQKPAVTLDDLMKAFVFYHKNDAFISLQ